jgi:hypothetical protein
MIRHKLQELARLLIDQTNHNQVRWEEAAQDAYRTTRPSVSIEVWRHEDWDEHPHTHADPVKWTMRVLDARGKLLDSMTDDSLQDLYDVARASALDLDTHIEEIIELFRNEG